MLMYIIYKQKLSRLKYVVITKYYDVNLNYKINIFL